MFDLDDESASVCNDREALVDVTARLCVMTLVVSSLRIYGKGVKGGFTPLLKLAKVTASLTFGPIKKWSLAPIEHLSDFLVPCSSHRNNRI